MLRGFRRRCRLWRHLQVFRYVVAFTVHTEYMWLCLYALSSKEKMFAGHTIIDLAFVKTSVCHMSQNTIRNAFVASDDEDNCEGVNCGRGSCVDGNNTYTCDCMTGYHGDHCMGTSRVLSFGFAIFFCLLIETYRTTFLYVLQFQN